MTKTQKIFKSKNSSSGTIAKFGDFIGQTRGPHPKRMPLVHTTDASGATKILESGEIQMKRCPHFSGLLGKDQAITYFFYGRAAYRSRTYPAGFPNGTLPVTFVVDVVPSTPEVHGLYPFDTGAFFGGMYSDYIEASYTVHDFALGHDLRAAQKLVKRFFQSNENYVKGRARQVPPFDSSYFSVSDYLKMVESKHIQKADDRRHSVEVQFTSSVKLSDVSISCLFAPELLADSRVFQRLLQKYAVKVQYYDVTGGCLREHQGIINSKTNSWMKETCE